MHAAFPLDEHPLETSLSLSPTLPYQVVVVFLYNMIAGSFINQYEAIVKNPTSFITIIGEAIPQTASFFITYILTAGKDV